MTRASQVVIVEGVTAGSDRVASDVAQARMH
jgi:hypothetical protein